MATLSYIAVYPVGALDPASVDRVSFTEGGGLVGDHAYVIVDSEGTPVEGRRTDAVHPLRSTADFDSGHIVLRVDDRMTQDPPGELPNPGQFSLGEEREAIEAWLSTYFGTEVRLRTTGDAPGPTLLARATLREVASWYDLTAAELRLRVRPNFVVAGVPAFWEEKLVGNNRRVRLGDAVLDSDGLVGQSVVTSRDPYTGVELPEFRESFERRRRETLPDWTDPETLDGDYYRLSVRLQVPESERDGQVAVGDEVAILEA